MPDISTLRSLPVQEILFRVVASALFPIWARFRDQRSLEQQAQLLLNSKRVRLGQQIAKIGIKHYPDSAGLRASLALSHILRSEWNEALLELVHPVCFARDENLVLIAQVMEQLKRPGSALAMLRGLETPEALSARLRIALHMRDTEEIANTITASEVVPKGPARLIGELVRTRHFEYFLKTPRFSLLCALADALSPEARQALIIQIGIAKSPKLASQLVESVDKISTTSSTFEMLSAIVDRMYGAGGSETSLSAFQADGWQTEAVRWLPAPVLIASMQRSGILAELMSDEQTQRVFRESFAGSPELNWLLQLETQLAETSGLLGTDQVSSLTDLLLQLAQSKEAHSFDLSGLTTRLTRFLSPTETTKFLERCLNVLDDDKFFDVVSEHVFQHAGKDFAESPVLLSRLEKLTQKSEIVLTLSRVGSVSIARKALDAGLRNFPGDYRIYKAAARLALNSDRQNDKQAILSLARQNLPQEDYARVCIVAEEPEKADAIFRSLLPRLGVQGREEWVRSLVRRGNIKDALRHFSADQTSSIDQDRIASIKKAQSILKADPRTKQFPSVNPSAPADLTFILPEFAATQYTGNGVLMITSTLRPGGAERQVAMTTAALSHALGRDVPIHVVARTLASEINADFFVPNIEATGTVVSDLEHFSVPEDFQTAEEALLQLLPDELVEMARPIYHLLKQEKPAVLHLWQDRTSLAGMFAGLLAGTPHILVSLRSTRPDARRRYRAYQRDLYRAFKSMFSDRIRFVNNSDFGARDYEDWLDFPEGYIETLHNGFDLQQLHKAAAIPTDFTFSIPESSFCLGWVGRFTFEKRPDVWTDVAIELARTNPDFVGLAVGDGPMLPELKAAVANAGLSDRIHFVGQQRPVEPFMKKMNTLLTSSEREGLPNVLIEAQGLGVPVVTVDVGGAKEAINVGETGLVVADTPMPGLTKDIAAAIQTLIDGPELRKRMAINGPDWVKSQFSLEVLAKKTLAVYEMRSRQSAELPESANSDEASSD